MKTVIKWGVVPALYVLLSRFLSPAATPTKRALDKTSRLFPFASLTYRLASKKRNRDSVVSGCDVSMFLSLFPDWFACFVRLFQRRYSLRVGTDSTA